MSDDGCPLVSIGMPVYNAEQSISRALDCLLGQTLSDIEVIISDNASNDGTEAICRRYEAADSRVRYVRQSSNTGAIANFVYVLRQARARHFAWLSCDDYYESPRHLERLFEKALEGPYALVFPSVKVLRAGGDGSAPVRHYDLDTLLGGCRTRFELNRAIVKQYGVSHQFYGMFDRELVGNLDRLLESQEDLCCFNEGVPLHWVHSRCDTAFAGDIVFCYVIHDSQLSRTAKSRHLLRDMLRYTWRVGRVYAGSDYTLWQKMTMLATLAPIHSRAILHLSASSAKHAALSATGAHRRKPALQEGPR